MTYTVDRITLEFARFGCQTRLAQIDAQLNGLAAGNTATINITRQGTKRGRPAGARSHHGGPKVPTITLDVGGVPSIAEAQVIAAGTPGTPAPGPAKRVLTERQKRAVSANLKKARAVRAAKTAGTGGGTMTAAAGN